MGLGRLGAALTAREIRELVHADLQRVEHAISVETIAPAEAITAISRHLQSNGGKRLRPMLLLLANKLIGETNDSAIQLGAVVEMIHAATLVHDDVIDDARTRRGKPSANVLWGNQTCVLAGDWLYMQAFQIALKQRHFPVLDILIALTQSMVEGELRQLETLGRHNLSESDYMELVDRKTANLFAACARLGAIAAGADEDREIRLHDFGWNLGMAFQLIDDILDFTSNESTLGKPVGNDLREGKVTLPLIYALSDAPPEEAALVQCVLRDRSYENVTFGQILDLLNRYDGIDRARERARVFTEKARAIVNGFPASPYQRALLAVTDLITDRDH